ncbi:MAG: hypothetical protein A2W22_05230 [Candidatus Levybacteria bacterium RBG_16_35_11]|nr:MAG: hypothetical protein A2W22_05230 [Candidatus Levybacteria bacterium RBG_16_35_11]
MKKLIFSLYFLFLVFFDWFSYLFVDPNISYLKSIYTGYYLTNRGEVASIYSLLVVIFFIFFFYFLKLVKNKNLSLKEIIFLIAFSSLILLFSYPAMLSYDIFNYIATAKVAFFYGENPYLVMPIEFGNEPILAFMQAANKTALYGPFWILLTGIPFFLGFSNFIATLFSFKIFVSSFYVLTCFLSYKLSKDRFTLVLIGLNPLILIESLISSHNDIVMMFFALLSVYFLLRNGKVKSYLFLFFSFLIKFATFFLLPVFLVFKKIKDRQKFLFLFLSMFAIFLLSNFREIYPWYAIWFLVFAFLTPKNKIILWVSLAFSFSLLFRYIPFMYFGTHFGNTPLIKTSVSFFFPFATLIYLFFAKRLNR